MKHSITTGDAGVHRKRRPTGRSRASGRFVLRLDSGLHGLLRDEALAAGLSLNDWCGRTLAAPGAGGLLDAAPGVVLTIRSRLGSDLLGVIVYGSFARGELTGGSDVDLLVVLEAGVPITRSLYREWEGAVPAWNGREIDLHFVHLPAPDDQVSGSWAEAAVCGIVLSDRDLAISRRLIAIRERIAAGALARRMSQGQPYWIHEAPDAQS
ncbi:MAG: nucleotidyltransferase domain-containing protein [Planctomycetia bacterium]|nr:nucleotidyltransferase domain-containing protein [Planctomycetia bacterium]